MVTKGIIKNVHKFNNIKLAKGIELELYTTQERSTETVGTTGVSTESYGGKWFITPKGRALFKSFDTRYGEEIWKIRIYNELLCQELCRQVGIRCAQYERATFEGLDGLVTYDIAKDCELINIENFIYEINNELDINLLSCSEVIDEYMLKGYNINKRQVMTDLYKIIVFDTLTMQTDRNIYNINLLYDEVANRITVAPLIDNEFAFCGERLMAWLLEENTEIENTDYDNVVLQHSRESKIFTFDEGYYSSNKQFDNNIENLTFYAKKHPAFKNALEQIVKNINPKLAIEKLKLSGVKASKEYEEFVCKIVQLSKEKILNSKHKRVSKELINDYENIY
ncbi:MAG: hypothetical protein E7376_01295 [Clostridiales bacterium]|nr:hypothetical protein [Clostridiales bacterium]